MLGPHVECLSLCLHCIDNMLCMMSDEKLLMGGGNLQQGRSQDFWKGVLKNFSAAALAAYARARIMSGWGRFCLPHSHTQSTAG